MTKLNKINKN